MVEHEEPGTDEPTAADERVAKGTSKGRGLPSFAGKVKRPDLKNLPTVKIDLPKIPLDEIAAKFRGQDSNVLAAGTGAVIGFGLALLTFGMLRSCEAIRGTETCGGSGGFILLLVLLAGSVYVGGLIMAALDLPEPTSTSFLAVGVLSVITMLFFLDSVTSGWMFLVIPLLTAACFAGSHWLTANVIDAADDSARR